MKTILMTGAAGGIGTYLRPELKDKYALRLSDRDSIDDLGDDETFMQAELTDLDALCAAMEGVDGILHFGGHASEGEWEAILDANIIGMRNIYEAARLSSVKRVIWASSNHACQWRSKKGPPRRCKKGPLGGCGLVPVVHGRAPRATRRALNRLTRRRAREGPVGPRGQAWAGWSVQLAVGV